MRFCFRYQRCSSFSRNCRREFCIDLENETTNNGDEVSTLLNSQNSDDDTGATIGIAVFNATLGSNGTGTWEYSTDSGSNWSALGSVSTSAALLLRSTDYIRFVPDGANGESVNPYVEFYVWDGSHSFAGTTADASVRAGTDHTTNFSENSGLSEIVALTSMIHQHCRLEILIQ